MNVKSRLHLHNHNEPNGRAFIIGEKEALRKLGETLIKASQNGVGLETIDLFTSDGHKYTLVATREVSEDEWQNMPLPYDKKHDPNKLEIIQTYDEILNQR